MFWKGSESESASCVHEWNEVENKDDAAEGSDSIEKKLGPAAQYKYKLISEVDADSIAVPVISALWTFVRSDRLRILGRRTHRCGNVIQWDHARLPPINLSRAAF